MPRQRGRIGCAVGDPLALHPRVPGDRDPSPDLRSAHPAGLGDALEQVDCWLEVPTVVLLAEANGYWPALRETLEASRVAGPRVHDARIATLCRQHGVRELWTAHRDFGRFPGLRFKNPLVAAG